VFAAHAMRGSRDARLTAGMGDYLAKPFTPAALLDITARWLRKTEPGFEVPCNLVSLVGAGNAEEVAGTPHETPPGTSMARLREAINEGDLDACNAP
jgi:CheY-like chemotaxis protein